MQVCYRRQTFFRLWFWRDFTFLNFSWQTVQEKIAPSFCFIISSSSSAYSASYFKSPLFTFIEQDFFLSCKCLLSFDTLMNFIPHRWHGKCLRQTFFLVWIPKVIKSLNFRWHLWHEVSTFSSPFISFVKRNVSSMEMATRSPHCPQLVLHFPWLHFYCRC